MSYYAKIRLFSDVRPYDIYQVMRSLIDEQKKHMESIVEEHIEYAMIQVDFPITKSEWEALPRNERNKMRKQVENLLHRHFGFTFLYWEKQELLGALGDTKRGEMVEFQNSCDNDYEYDYWKNIPCLSALVKSYQNLSDEKVREKYRKKYEMDMDEDDPIDYYRRTFLYDAIVKELDIEDFLYNTDSFSSHHTLLSVNTMESQEDNYRFSIAVQKAINKQYESQLPRPIQ